MHSVYEVDGEKRNMACTQFEPADARRCFPCWDEPSVKVAFRNFPPYSLRSSVNCGSQVLLVTSENYNLDVKLKLSILLQATFKIILHVPSDRVALSNMPIAEEEQTSPRTKTITFEETPRMSTYLVAIVVGEFEYVEGHTKDGKLLGLGRCSLEYECYSRGCVQTVPMGICSMFQVL